MFGFMQWQQFSILTSVKGNHSKVMYFFSYEVCARRNQLFVVQVQNFSIYMNIFEYCCYKVVECFSKIPLAIHYMVTY